MGVGVGAGVCMCGRRRECGCGRVSVRVWAWTCVGMWVWVGVRLFLGARDVSVPQCVGVGVVFFLKKKNFVDFSFQSKLKLKTKKENKTKKLKTTLTFEIGPKRPKRTKSPTYTLLPLPSQKNTDNNEESKRQTQPDPVR